MSSLQKIISIAVFSLSTAVIAQGEPSNTNGKEDSSKNLSRYLQNLGKYLGYDLSQYCTTPGPCGGQNQAEANAPTSAGTGSYTSALLDKDTVKINITNLFSAYLGSFISGDNTGLIPASSNSAYAFINSIEGKSLQTPPYNQTSGNGVSVSPLVDQQTYQKDPVSQSILNIITTPDYSYCAYSKDKCTYKDNNAITAGAIGKLPRPDTFFSFQYAQKFLGELNIDSLVTPLMYATQEQEQDNSSAGSSGNPNKDAGEQNDGLLAKTQAQKAANFIRYATGMVLPIALPDLTTYNKLYNQALNINRQSSNAEQQYAKNTLLNYLAKLRVYTAQSSVAISNLYYILSKRMPQTLSSQDKPSSQALDELKMATWRIYNPEYGNNPNQKQWIDAINQASQASVQKEIAILLAEINYQMYLSRQQQERLLLTNSILLLQNARGSSSQPTLMSIETQPPSNLPGMR